MDAPTAAVREEFDRLFDRCDTWPSSFNLAALGGHLMRHPELVGREKTARMLADEEHRARTRR